MLCLTNVPNVHFVNLQNFNSEFIESHNNPSILIYDPNVMQKHPLVKEAILRLFNIIDLIAITEIEPSSSSIENIVKKIKHTTVSQIISFGGGSTIDTAKGISLLLNNDINLPEEFKHTLGLKNILNHIAIPTTAGPGVEVSPALIFKNSQGIKTAVVDNFLIPKEIIIDPIISTTLSEFYTACTVFDGISHSFESLLTPNSPTITKQLALSALKIFISNLPKALNEPHNPLYRDNLHQASILSGIGLRLTGSNIVHIISSIIEFNINAPHGASVAASLLVLLDFDKEILSKNNYVQEMLYYLNFNDISQLYFCLLEIYNNNIINNLTNKSIEINDKDFEAFIEIKTSDQRMNNYLYKLNEKQVKIIATNVFKTLNSHSTNYLTEIPL